MNLVIYRSSSDAMLPLFDNDGLTHRGSEEHGEGIAIRRASGGTDRFATRFFS
jgi:hypothetical protein